MKKTSLYKTSMENQLTLPMVPHATNNAYHTNGGRWYKDKSIHDWEEECLWMLKGIKTEEYEEYLVDIDFYFGDKRKNDIDGRIKPVLDVLQKAGVYRDDSLVTQLHVEKHYDKENPRVVVFVLGV